MHKLDTLMFPSEDPFAYPNQPMMELGFNPNVNMNNQQGSQYYMPESMDDMDGHLIGQPPPYVIQHPEGQPGFEFSANMFDPNTFGMHMGHQSQPHMQQPQHSMHPSQAQAYMQQQQHQQRRPRRQDRQIDQMFTEQGMQADFGSFFGSGRGVFQGM